MLGHLVVGLTVDGLDVGFVNVVVVVVVAFAGLLGFLTTFTFFLGFFNLNCGNFRLIFWNFGFLGGRGGAETHLVNEYDLICFK